MDRKIKVAAATSLLALTAAACAPNPYYGNTGYNYGNRGVNTTVNRGNVGNNSGGVTHTHCGRTHSHVLPPEGLAHQHGDGCMAGAGGAAPVTNTNTSAYNNYGNYGAQQPQQPAANSYGYTAPASPSYYDYSAGTASSGTYTAPASNNYGSSNYSSGYNAGASSGSYYDYAAPKATPKNTYRSTVPAAPRTSSVTTPSTGGSSYTVQKGDTVFQVMRNTGVYWKDIIRLNNLEAPNYPLNPGQRLKLK
jgi:LysM repeat protein